VLATPPSRVTATHLCREAHATAANPGRVTTERAFQANGPAAAAPLAMTAMTAMTAVLRVSLRVTGSRASQSSLV
jgi:hypothetical protein